MSSNCKDPKCSFSKRFSKCIKPNPYIETISKCKREQIKKKDCKYYENKKQTIDNICDYYRERINKIKCVDPKCLYSNRYKKCIKANSYIEMIAKCGREKIKRKDCKYNENKEKAIKETCKNYKKRISTSNKKKIVK